MSLEGEDDLLIEMLNSFESYVVNNWRCNPSKNMVLPDYILIINCTLETWYSMAIRRDVKIGSKLYETMKKDYHSSKK